MFCPQDDISRLYLYPDGKENSAAKQNLATISNEIKAKQNLAAISNEIKLKSVKKEPGCDVMAEQQVWSLWYVMLCYDIVEKEFTSQQPSTSREMEEWKENEFLPKGWR